MAFRIRESAVITFITGMWITAFALVALFRPSSFSAAVLGLLILLGAYAIWKVRHWKVVAAYAAGSGVTFIVYALFSAGLL